VKLDVDADELAACVSCGLCLPHCPTYRVTGDESASPRGRIAAMRAIEADDRPLEGAFTEFMDLCVQCRGCETACPSSVPFGRLMEGSRHTLTESTRYQPWLTRAAYRSLRHHRLLLLGSSLLALAQRARLVPRRFGLPALPVRRTPLKASGDDVWLFTGCVMDAWLRPTHANTLRVIEATGAGVALPDDPGCCGALQAHAGLMHQARDLAERTMRAFPGEAPILVNSAGCGAQLKDYGHLLDTPEATAFGARVLDVHEWLAPRIATVPAPRGNHRRVALQDPCHLRHVQRAHLPVRTVLAPFVDVIELDDEGLCCGAGGAYSAQHPEMATAIRDRKVAAIARTGAKVVASANPGCALWLRDAGLDVRHPLDLVAEAMDGR
jgi:glycolate oxidase iron-sulfur subunit